MSNKIHKHHKALHTHQEAPYVKAFIAKILPIAQKVKAKWGVPISVLIAQGALESAWGQHVEANAYFGIKGKSSSGDSVDFSTHEVVDGKSVAITDSFRAYVDMDEAADDYGRFLKTNHRYYLCFLHADKPDLFVDQLTKAGYATDPKYGSKLKTIMHSHHLSAYDRSGKSQ